MCWRKHLHLWLTFLIANRLFCGSRAWKQNKPERNERGTNPQRTEGRKIHKRALGCITCSYLSSPPGLYGTCPASYHPSEWQAAWWVTPVTPALRKAEVQGCPAHMSLVSEKSKQHKMMPTTPSPLMPGTPQQCWNVKGSTPLSSITAT